MRVAHIKAQRKAIGAAYFNLRSKLKAAQRIKLGSKFISKARIIGRSPIIVTQNQFRKTLFYWAAGPIER